VSGQDGTDGGDGIFAIDIDDDVLAAALSAVAERARPSRPPAAEAKSAPLTPPNLPPVELDLTALDNLHPPSDLEDQAEGVDDALDELSSIEVVLDEHTLDAHAEAAELEQEERKATAAELEALTSRVVDLEDALREEKEGRLQDQRRLQHVGRDRNRQVALVRRLEDKLGRVEQHRQGLMNERDEALDRADRAEHEQNLTKKELARHRDRARRAQEDVLRHGPGPVLLAILPALDNLELAMSHADADHGRLIEGVLMIIQQFHQSLVRLGVVRVPAESGGPFDPEIHEAMLEEQSEVHPVGTIAHVITPGYRLQGRLLRPARVAVVRAANTSGETWIPSTDWAEDDPTQPRLGEPVDEDDGDSGLAVPVVDQLDNPVPDELSAGEPEDT